MQSNTPADKGTVTRPPTGGIAVDHWFWAAVDKVGTSAPQLEEKTPENADKSQSDATDIGKLLAEHPGISGPTFYNLLKSKGWKLVSPTEADSSSAQPVGILAGEKAGKGIDPDKFDRCVDKVKKAGSADNAYAVCNATLGKESNKLSFRARFLESTPRGDTAQQGLSFRCVLLQEGLGNLKDAYYYSKDALTSAVPVFEGKKIYADHPSSVEEQVRPERSVRDVLGHFENVSLEESDDGVSRLVGDVKILPDQSFAWARSLMRHSVDYAQKYPDKDFVGLSINAGGDAEEADIEKVLESAPAASKLKLEQAKDEGINKVRWVSKITEAVSCDLVTEAGAGGKVVAMLESDKTKEEKEMEKKHESETEKKEAAPAVDGEQPAAKHDDEAQDIELIKKMISEYLGDEEHSEETMHAAKQAHDAAKGIGLDGDEAYQSAGKMLKMARHMKQKQSEDEAKMKQEESEDEKAMPMKQEESESECENEKAKQKESAQLIKLRGENAALAEKLAVLENEKYLDKLLRESKLPMSVTKKFREALGEKVPAKREEIEAKFKLFREGAKAAGEGDFLGALVIQPEKTGEVKTSVDFSDCLN